MVVPSRGAWRADFSAGYALGIGVDGFYGVFIAISVFIVVAMKNFALLTGRLGRNAVPTHQIASIILGCLFVIIELILNAVVPLIILQFVVISGAVAAVAVGVAFSVGVVVAVAVSELFDQTFLFVSMGRQGFTQFICCFSTFYLC